MKSLLIGLIGCAALSAPVAARAADSAVMLDLKKAAPAQAHMAIYVKHNPERDFQTEYFKDAWETFREERIVERIVEMVASRAPKDKMAKAQDAWDQVKEALDPIEGSALMDAEECVVSQQMDGPVNHTVLALRLSDQDAADYRQGIGQLFELVQKWSDGKVTAETTDSDDATITRLALPKDSPIQPAVARLGDVFIVSTSFQLVEQSIAQLQDESATSKFDDPRLAEAAEHLPEAEDVLAFFDGRQLFESLRKLPDYVREQTREEVGDSDDKKEKMERVLSVLSDAIDECAIIDYIATVEYTEDNQNRKAELGKLTSGHEDTLLGKALTQGEPFDDWQQWVPADATAYSLSTGVKWHVLYTGVLDYVRDEFPEAEEALAKWEEMQEQVDVDVAEDVLRSFSGESVSVTMPGSGGSGRAENVVASKCENPEKIRELLDRAIDGLQKIPAVQAQNLSLEDCEDLDGFQEIKAMSLEMAGAKPVIGFQDGWMIIASSAAGAEKFLEVRAGDADSIADSDEFQKFNLDAAGSVYRVSYSDVGAGVRAAADFMEQIGMMLPMYAGMAMQNSKPEDKKLANDVFGLIPSVAKVVRKFDFFEDKLSIMKTGPLPDSYLRETVTIIRQPDGE